MQVFSSLRELRSFRSSVTGSVGFIPTMGFLHEGHLKLVTESAQQNDSTVVSIFVNPAQFGPNEDFAKYPRDTEHDLALLKEVDTTAVFLPTVEEIYPDDFQTTVEVKKVSQGLEGERRPAHFAGVATVVSKLFNIIQPTRAYFGQKDAQQVAVIRQMIKDLAFPIEMIVVPTVRAKDGLALSSRNTYLTTEQRQAAPVLYRALQTAAALYEKGERDPQRLRQNMTEVLATEPLAAVDYVSVAAATTLQELTKPSQEPLLFSMAVRFGKTRLIDNIVVSQK